VNQSDGIESTENCSEIAAGKRERGGGGGREWEREGGREEGEGRKV